MIDKRKTQISISENSAFYKDIRKIFENENYDIIETTLSESEVLLNEKNKNSKLEQFLNKKEKHFQLNKKNQNKKINSSQKHFIKKYN